jgi:hypothetical protein
MVGADEYHSHGRWQTVFSYLPLGIQREEDAPPYRHYSKDSAGLYVAAGTVDEAENVFPPYPFDDLAAFVEGAGQPVTVPSGGPLLIFIALAALLPFAILRVRHENL